MFRKDYGKASIDYDIFGDNPNYSFSSLILRNSGNDWDKTMFRDLLMHSLLKESRLDLQNYLPVSGLYQWRILGHSQYQRIF
jgi:hypothetical protein